MTAGTPTPSSVVKHAEQQMRSWTLGLEVRERIEHDKAISQLPEAIHPYVAISRETGAGGTDIARRLGQQRGWAVLDKELLDYMAQRYKLPRGVLEFVDENTSNWLYELFGKWLNRQVITQSEYVGHLGPIVLMAARHASSIFVGRGAQFLLPRQRGITVRIIAPLEQRVQVIAERQQVSREEAEKRVAKTDEGRREFVQRYFHRDVSDPHFYDLVVNLEQIELDAALDLMIGLCRSRFGLGDQ